MKCGFSGWIGQPICDFKSATERSIMAKSETLPIFLDTYKVVLDIYRATGKLPREYRYSLGEDMKKDALNLLRLIFIANHQKNKAETLSQFLAALEIVQLQIRLTYDLRAMPIKTMTHINLGLDGVGRQANAWFRNERSKQLKKQESSATEVSPKG